MVGTTSSLDKEVAVCGLWYLQWHVPGSNHDPACASRGTTSKWPARMQPYSNRNPGPRIQHGNYQAGPWPCLKPAFRVPGTGPLAVGSSSCESSILQGKEGSCLQVTQIAFAIVSGDCYFGQVVIG